MPKIDDLLEKHGKQIADETKRFSSGLNQDVPRDPVRRPWNGLDEEIDFANEPKSQAAWYDSWSSIRSSFRRHSRPVALTIALSFALLSVASLLRPSVYNSTMHLYAPEKSDTITSRLPLFSNRVEFASFPVDSKIPLALIARRLKLEPAKIWVVDQYRQAAHEGAVELDASTVSADTFYAEGSELLVISGRANDPQIAADITALYWNYLEAEIEKMHQANLAKVTHWIELTTNSLNQKMTAIAMDLNQTSAIRPIEAKIQVHSKLAENYADLEMKRLKTVKERDELRGALSSSNRDKIWQVSISEINDLGKIDEALREQELTAPSPQTSERRKEILNQAFEFARGLLSEKEREVTSIQGQTQKLRSQLSIYQGEDSMTAQGTRVRELLRQQSEYQAQADELYRLKNQIAVESTMTHTRLQLIQAALPDPGSRHPRPAVTYAVCAMMSLLMGLLALMWLQRRPAPALAMRSRSSSQSMEL